MPRSTLTQLTDVPNRSQPGTFSDRADALWPQINTLVGQMNGAAYAPTRTVIKTGSGTYNPPTGCQAIFVQVQGGGGGGGGVDGQGSGTSALGGGGGGGAYVEMMIDGPAASYSYTVGAGGAGGAAGNNAGSAGSDSTFSGGGETLSAGGGTGGGGHVGSAGTAACGTPGLGGAATGGDVNVDGEDATWARVITGAFTAYPHGTGSAFGRAGTTTNNSAGADATGRGAGGAGGLSTGAANNYGGGDGSKGLIIITEFY